MATIEEVLELARWAPSADNVQPWRFEVIGPDEVLVHGMDSRSHCVYDLDGRITQIALGALLETLRLAAADAGRVCVVEGDDFSEGQFSTIRVALPEHSGVVRDPLVMQIPHRTVQRRGMSSRPLSPDDKHALQSSLPDGWSVRWFESVAEKVSLARVLFSNGKLRLTLPEAFPVHKETIRWGTNFAEEGIPAAAVGLDCLTLILTRWAMQRWSRIHFLNRYLAGTLLPCIELDAWPAMACGAIFALVSPESLDSKAHYLAAGRATQRFWLTASRLGLQLQPTVSPLVFARYRRDRREFTREQACVKLAATVSRGLDDVLGREHVPKVGFMGRVGYGNGPKARSIRLPLKALRGRFQHDLRPGSVDLGKFSAERQPQSRGD